MRVLVSGSTGMIGTALCRRLMAEGHHVVRLTRRAHPPSPAVAPIGTTVTWNPSEGTIDAGQLEGLDAVAHLAGEPVAAGRWTDQRKYRILHSRVRGTELLCEALADRQHPPKVLISASAVGYYGDRGDEWLTETALPGGDFLADVCRQWEAATEAAAERGLRVVNPRFGMVLSQRGGAMKRLLPIFRLGLGGRLGPGTQFVSWITLDDTIGALMHLLTAPEARGPFNIVAPDPVTNAALTDTLGRVLHRPTLMDVPMFAVRAVFGEMADALLLAGQRAMAAKLAQTGYRFQHEDIEQGLRAMLER